MKTHKGKFKIQDRMKRLIDILISAMALFFLAPILVLIAIAIRLDSPGNPIFSHRRIGRGGKAFNVYKFRSMYCGCDEKDHLQHLQKLIENEQAGKDAISPYRKRDIDLRVTRLGCYLRKYYIDELPQLWNILRGEMSLVGPRPHVQMEVDHYTKEQIRRLDVRPGLTGLWQATGKANCTFSDLIQLDLDYIDHWSLKLDLQIMFYTFITILKGGEGFWARRANEIYEKSHADQVLPVPDIFLSDQTKPKEEDWTFVK
jgi:lipopolysaccharide/colanic/teichoic acid biosynthesis glycosyltransferase